MERPAFIARGADAAGVLSWVHVGDLHMTAVGEQNDLDLRAMIETINRCFVGSISFVFLPGDVAEHGDAAAYGVVRSALERLEAPWCATVGDHDVHEKSFANFVASMAVCGDTRYAFTAAGVRFVAINAFEVPHPASFAVLPDQLEWVEEQLKRASEAGQDKVVLMHCYPTDLKQGGPELAALLARYGVLLVEMGHTHYNEISNDGRTLYTATRSTGQIEEGPVGFSVTNLDGGVVSWRFVPLGELPAVMITSPGDERMETAASPANGNALRVRAKVWGDAPVLRVWGSAAGQRMEMEQVAGSRVWQGVWSGWPEADGMLPLRVTAEDAHGRVATDEIRVLVPGAARGQRERQARDQDNALAAWPEHGLLGTQLGPNKNGRKW